MTELEAKLVQAFEEIAAAHLKAAAIMVASGGATSRSRDQARGASHNGRSERYKFDVAPFGTKKGIPFAEHTSEELRAWEERFGSELDDPAKAKWRKNTQRQLECVRSILSDRGRANGMSAEEGAP